MLLCEEYTLSQVLNFSIKPFFQCAVREVIEPSSRETANATIAVVGGLEASYFRFQLTSPSNRAKDDKQRNHFRKGGLQRGAKRHLDQQIAQVLSDSPATSSK